jgi:hypothetical protein
MKTLHFDLYQNQKVGMSNVVMSAENALIIAFLTKRDKIIFYGNEFLFNSQTKRIQDLYTILFDVEFKEASEKPIVDSLPSNFYDTVFYYQQEPNANFINKRKSCIDLKKWEDKEEFSTLNNETLGYYSYLFYLDQERIPILNRLKETFFPKLEYQQKAKDIVDSINSLYAGFNSVHVRRGDYLHTSAENKNITAQDFLPVLEEHLEQDKLLLVHTDEQDLSYFQVVKEKYPNIWFIDSVITGDTAERGLISMLVASFSDKFIGTMKSTFTGLIQRYRIYNGKLEDFIFLYSQLANISLERGMFKKESFAQYAWNYSYLTPEFKQIAFWIREFESCYPQERYPVQALRIYPNFITTEESSYIIEKAKANTSEYYERETRNRFILGRTDPVAKAIMERSCEALGYDVNKIESSIQVFTQYKDGQTFWHMDSLAPDYQGLRIASILFYLNEDFRGSKIEFPFLGVTWQPKKNTMLSYPLVNEFGEMNKLTSHSASIITEGTKYMCYFDIKEKNY